MGVIGAGCYVGISVKLKFDLTCQHTRCRCRSPPRPPGSCQCSTSSPPCMSRRWRDKLQQISIKLTKKQIGTLMCSIFQIGLTFATFCFSWLTLAGSPASSVVSNSCPCSLATCGRAVSPTFPAGPSSFN